MTIAFFTLQKLYASAGLMLVSCGWRCGVRGAKTVQTFRVAFKDSPVTRTKRRGLARNAATVLGNIGMKDDVPLLTAALNDPEPIVREAAGCALGKIGAR